jgi:hypothetical protein
VVRARADRGTLHDILFESYPEFYTGIENLYFRAWVTVLQLQNGGMMY